MGSGASKPAVREVTPEALAALPAPKVTGEIALLSVLPEGELQKKGDLLLLEVGPSGFRILKAGTGDPIYLFPWGQVHSWAHGTNRFSFRFFDDNKHTIVQHAMAMNNIDLLLEHIAKIIDTILAERRKSAISDDDFNLLMEELNGMNGDAERQLDRIGTAAAAYTFMSGQAQKVLKILPTTFDKIEAATVLHSRLIDQNHFSTVLDVLECQADRDNVWHRITTMKRGGMRT